MKNWAKASKCLEILVNLQTVSHPPMVAKGILMVGRHPFNNSPRVARRGMGKKRENMYMLDKFRYCPVCGSKHFEESTAKANAAAIVGLSISSTPVVPRSLHPQRTRRTARGAAQGRTRTGHARPAWRLLRHRRDAGGRHGARGTGGDRTDADGGAAVSLLHPQCLSLWRIGGADAGRLLPLPRADGLETKAGE